MKKILCVASYTFLVASTQAQNISQKIGKAYQQFEADSQLRHAIVSLYVINAKNGKVVFDKNSQIGLAPASTQKIITATTAFELLGKNYQYKTEFGYYGQIKDHELNGNLYVSPSGDPTLGSWRWQSTDTATITGKFSEAIKKLEINNILGSFVYEKGKWENEIPDGWIWQDVGNYYGAGASILNWHENQYDLILRSGATIGDPVKVVSTFPKWSYPFTIFSEVKSAAQGTGDNAYIYLPSDEPAVIKVKGTVPINEENFKISGSLLAPSTIFMETLFSKIGSLKISMYSGTYASPEIRSVDHVQRDASAHTIYDHYSPTLDSIIYWFLQRSINLYGEALIKTFGFEKKGFGATDSGVVIVKDFWKQKGIDDEELNIMDGSGLSPQNRVTTHAQVEILKYAKTKDWFPYFYAALPTFNGMKMKSGSIRDVKGFCGYQRASDGNEYIFSFLINNYNGTSSAIIRKMYRVLDTLK